METLVKVSPKQVVNDIYAAFGRGDLQTILSHLSPDIVWEAMGKPSKIPYVGIYKGIDNVPQFFIKLNDVFKTTDFQVHEVLQNGNVVTAYGLHHGIGIKSGVASGTNFAMRWEFNDEGKVIKYNNFFDTEAIGKSF